MAEGVLLFFCLVGSVFAFVRCMHVLDLSSGIDNSRDKE